MERKEMRPAYLQIGDRHAGLDSFQPERRRHETPCAEDAECGHAGDQHMHVC